MKVNALFFFMFLIFIAAQMPSQGNKKIVFYCPRGPSAVGIVQFIESPPRFPGWEIKIETTPQADLLAGKFISGEAKIGMLPANVAAKIASSGKKIQVAAVTGTGMLSLLSADPAVRNFNDLKGKTVEVAGQGATPDYIFRKILITKGINPDRDLNLRYALAYPEIAQAMIAGRVSLALLPEPFATMARMGNNKIFTVGDIQEEWRRINGGADYPMTILAVDRAFAVDNPALVRIILENIKASLEWVRANPAGAGELVEKHNLGLKAAAAERSIPRSNYVFIPAQEARGALEALYRIFLEFAPASIGGILPGDDFYYPQ